MPASKAASRRRKDCGTVFCSPSVMVPRATWNQKRAKKVTEEGRERERERTEAEPGDAEIRRK